MIRSRQKKKEQRKRVYIKKRFQNRFLIRYVLILVFGGVLFVALTLFYTQGTLTTSFANSRLSIQNTSFAILPSVVYITVLTVILIGLMAAMLTLFMSHKIAGPMYRFEKEIKRIADGDLKQPVQIRKGDQLQELSTSLNDMIDNLSENLKDIRSAVSQAAANENLPADSRKNFLKMNELINSRFKLQDS